MKTTKPDLSQDEWLALRDVFINQMQGDYSTAPVLLNGGVAEAVANGDLTGLIFQKPGEAYEAFNFLAADHSTETAVKPELDAASWTELHQFIADQPRESKVAPILDAAMQAAVSAKQLTGVLFDHPGQAYEGLAYLLAQAAK